MALFGAQFLSVADLEHIPIFGTFLCRDLSADLSPFEPIWPVYGLYMAYIALVEPQQAISGHIGSIWPICLIWPVLACFEPIWPVYGLYEPVWLYMAYLDGYLACLSLFEPV